MEIIRGIEQGSEEWHELRRGRVTASEFSSVLAKGEGKTRARYMRHLLAERLTGRSQETFSNSYMQDGTEREPRARAMYELREGVDAEEVTIVLRDENVSCSPDALVGGSGGAEIKSPKATTHLEYLLAERLPPTHKPQVQGNLWVCERDWWDFVSFHPDMPEHSQLFVYRVYRDDDYIAKLESEVDRFVTEMLDLEAQLRGDAEALRCMDGMEGAA